MTFIQLIQKGDIASALALFRKHEASDDLKSILNEITETGKSALDLLMELWSEEVAFYLKIDNSIKEQENKDENVEASNYLARQNKYEFIKKISTFIEAISEHGENLIFAHENLTAFAKYNKNKKLKSLYPSIFPDIENLQREKEIQSSPIMIRCVRRGDFDKAINLASKLSLKEIMELDKNGKSVVDYIKNTKSHNLSTEREKKFHLLKNTLVKYGVLIENLNKATLPPVENFPTNLFAHIHNDAQLSGTVLQGSLFNITAPYLLHMVEEIIKKNNIPFGEELLNLQKKLALFIDIINNGVSQETIFSQLEANGEVLFPGGWCGTSKTQGHAMLYSFIKKEGKIIFLITNSGAGLENHLNLPTASGEQCLPVMAYEIPGDVSKEEFKEFIKTLLTPLKEGTFRRSYEDYGIIHYYNQEETYGNVISKVLFLGGKIIDPHPYSKDYMFPQLSGTCAWLVLMAWVKSQLGEKRFQEFDYLLKKNSLQEYTYANRVRHKEHDAIVQKQINFALQNFSILVNNLSKEEKEGKFSLTEQQVLEDNEFLKKISPSKVEIVGQKWNKVENFEASKSVVSDELECIQEFPGSTKKIKLERNTGLGAEALPKNDYVEQGVYKKSNDISDILETVEKLNTICEAQKNNNNFSYPQSMMEEFERAILSIDFNKELSVTIKDKSKIDCFNIFQKFYTAICFYGESCNKESLPTSARKRAIAYLAIAFLTKLANQYFEGNESVNGLSEFSWKVQDTFTWQQSYMSCVTYDKSIDIALESAKQYLTLVKKKEESQHKDNEIPHFSLIGIFNQYPNLKHSLSSETPYSLVEGNTTAEDRLIFNVLSTMSQYSTYRKARGKEALTFEDYLKDKFSKSFTEFPQDFLKLIQDLELACRFIFVCNISNYVCRGEVFCLESLPEHLEREQVFENLKIEFKDQTQMESNKSRTLSIGTKFLPIEPSLNFVSLDGTYYPWNNAIITESLYWDKWDTNEIEVKNTSLKDQNTSLTEDAAYSQALAHIRTQEITLIPALYDFFDQNIPQLEDPDFCLYLQLNLFKPGCLIHQIEKDAIFLGNLVDFIERGHKIFISDKSPSLPGCFFFQLTSIVQNHCSDYLQEKDKNRLKLIELDIQKQLKNNRTVNPEQKEHGKSSDSQISLNVLLHNCQILAARNLLRESKNFTLENTRDLLLSFTYIQHNRKENEIHPAMEDILLKILYEFLPKIKQCLDNCFEGQENQEVSEMLNAILINVFQDEEISELTGKWQWEYPYLQHFSKEDEKSDYCIDISSGQTYWGSVQLRIIPKKFYSKGNLLKSLLGDKILIGNISKNENIAEFSYKNSRYRYTLDPESLERLIVIENQADWYQYCHSSNEKKLLENFPLTLNEAGRTAWIRGTKEEKEPYTVVVMDGVQKSRNYLYSTQDKRVKELNENGENTGFILQNLKRKQDASEKKRSYTFSQNNANLLQVYQTYDNVDALQVSDFYKYITRFEDPRFIECLEKTLANGRKEVIIALPRYGLELVSSYNAKGEFEFHLKGREDFKLVIDEKPTSILPISNFLNFSAKDKDQTKSFVLVPYQQFYALEKNGKEEFYELEFDRSDFVRQKKFNVEKQDLSLKFESIEDLIKIKNISKWNFSAQEAFKSYEVAPDGTLVCSSNLDILYLAYLHMAAHQPILALERVREYEKNGGFTGNLEEAELLRRMLLEIPACLGEENEAVENAIRDNTPEMTAVRAKVAALFCLFRQNKGKLEFSKPKIDSNLSKNSQNSILNSSEVLEKFWDDDNFSYDLEVIYLQYDKLRNYIPKKMILDEWNELKILREIHQTHKKLSKEKKAIPRGVVTLRWRELEKAGLYQEKEELEALKAGSDITTFPIELQHRLDKINQTLKKTKIVTSLIHARRSMKIMIKPPSERTVARIQDTKKWYPKPKRLSVDELSLNCDEKCFLYSMENFYDIANTNRLNVSGYSTKEKEIDSTEREKLSSFVNTYLLAHYCKPFIANDMARGDSQEQNDMVSACVILYYVLQYPDTFKKNGWNDSGSLKFLRDVSISPHLQKEMVFEGMGEKLDPSLTIQILSEFEELFVDSEKNFKFDPKEYKEYDEINPDFHPLLNFLLIYLLNHKDAWNFFFKFYQKFKEKLITEDNFLEILKDAIRQALKSERRTKRYAEYKYIELKQPIMVDSSIHFITPFVKVDEILGSNELRKYYEKQISLQKELLRKPLKETQNKSDFFKFKKSDETFIFDMLKFFESDYERGCKINNIQEKLKSNSVQTLQDVTVRKELKKSFEDALKQSDNPLYKLKQDIIALASKPPTDKNERATWELEKLALQREDITFEKLLYLYLRGESNSFKEYTALGQEAVNRLNTMMNQYLVQATQQNQYKRILKGLDRVEAMTPENPEFSGALEELGKQLTSERQFDPIKQRELLLFEYFSDMTLYPEQAHYIQKLVETKGEKFNSQVLQLIMGGGKTKIITPLVMLLKATKQAIGTNLSVVEFPSSHLQTNSADLLSKLEEYFHQKGHIFTFDRNSDDSSATLKKIYKTFVSMMLSREILITTGDSIQSLELKYLELLMIGGELNAETKRQIKHLERILKLFRHQADVLIDEGHEGLKIRKELNYTIGESKPIPEEELQYTVDLYLFDTGNPDSPETPSFSLEKIITRKSPLPNKEALPTVLDQFINALMEHPNSPLFSIVSKLDKDHREAITSFLHGKKIDNKKYLLGLPKEDQDRLALYKGEIKKLLPLTLDRRPYEHFGFSLDPDKSSEESEIAIPYASNMTPNEKSRFGSDDETKNYTIQLQLLQKSLSENVVIRMFKDFKAKAKVEMQNAGWKVLESDTKAARAFKELTNMELLDIHLNDPLSLKKSYTIIVNIKEEETQKHIKDYCLVHIILPQIKRHSKILRSDSINHVSQYRSTQVMTGTPSNYQTFHSSIQFDPYGPSLGTDGQILDLLLKKNPPLHFTNSTSFNAIFKELFSQKKNVNLRAFIDSGALFEGSDNEAVAREISKTLDSVEPSLKIHYVLYFDKFDKLYALPVQQDSQNAIPIHLEKTDQKYIQSKLLCNPEHCFTYYDQGHCIGMDIKQMHGATAFASVNEKSKKDDIWQAVMRMRDLFGSQNVELVLPQSMRQSYPSVENWNMKELSHILYQNQINSLGEVEHLQSIFKKMKNCVRSRLLNIIFSIPENDIQRKQALFQAWSDIFSVSVNEDLYEKYAPVEETVDTLENIQAIKKSISVDFVQKLKAMNIELSQAELSGFEQEMNAIEELAKKICLKETKAVPQGLEQTEVMVQVQKEQSVQKELELQKQQEIELFEFSSTEHARPITSWKKQFNVLKFNLIEGKSDVGIEIVSLENMAKTHPKSAERSWKFDDSLLVTENFLKTCKNQTNFMNVYKKRSPYFLAIQDKDDLKFLFLTEEEIAGFQDKIKIGPDGKDASGRYVWIESVNQTLVMGHKPQEDLNPNYSRLLEQAQFFNGESSLLAGMRKNLNWLVDSHMENKLAFFRAVIAPKYPDRKHFIPRMEAVARKKFSNQLTDALPVTFSYPNTVKKNRNKNKSGPKKKDTLVTFSKQSKLNEEPQNKEERKSEEDKDNRKP